ncbi:hypothetical protein BDR05DRAFT_806136 [Suillus weaverae]|nr:hypothetical protein BDR05DRAFT_806136 [Suillus weaverae]
MADNPRGTTSPCPCLLTRDFKRGSIGDVVALFCWPRDRAFQEKPQVAQLQPLRGFDRLAAAGFSEDDIANFRRQFHSQSSSNYYLDSEFENEEDYDEHARALEEQWVDSMDNVNSASLSSASSQSLILRGIVIGFFFPIIPFFFLRETKAAVF